ncbi:MAG: GNAT family N-acetyltransferase [Thermosynechococcaceae cyanobacterium]
MASVTPKTDSVVRPLQYRDWEPVEKLWATINGSAERSWLSEPLPNGVQGWTDKPLNKVLNIIAGQWSSLGRTYVLEQAGRIVGAIQVAPFNRARSTWRVERLCLDRAASAFDAGTQLLRYCLETIWEARTWLVEVEVNHVETLGLYRQNGFQPLAQRTQWQLSPALLAQLADQSPSLPNLLPINHADAALLYQLDTAAMPPFVRQVLDRHVEDFQWGVLHGLWCKFQTQLNQQEQFTGYVFEPQRKAAIGYFGIRLDRSGTDTHLAQMTVHPAYTWLYPELLAHMAQLAQQLYPAVPIILGSADYQPEREAYLQQIGAERLEHTLMLSRSVWHKIRESKALSLETLQLTEMLQGLQPNHTPEPGRMGLNHLPFQSQIRGSHTQSRSRTGSPDPTQRTEPRPSRLHVDKPDAHGACG